MTKDAYKMLKQLNLHKTFIIMLILRSPFDTLMAVLSANLLNSFLRNIEFTDRAGIIGSFFLFLLFSFLLFAFNMTVWMTLGVKSGVLLQTRLRKKVFDTMLSLSPEKLEAYGTGDWITRLNNDIDMACNYFSMPVSYMHTMIAVVNVVISSVIMLTINIPLYVVAMVCMLPFFLLNTLIITVKIPKFRKSARQAFVRYTEFISPVIASRDVTEIFDGKDFMIKKAEALSNNICRENMKIQRRIAASRLVMTFSGALGYLLLLAAGSTMIGDSLPDFAKLTKVTQYRANMMKSTNCIGDGISNMRNYRIGIERVNEVISESNR